MRQRMNSIGLPAGTGEDKQTDHSRRPGKGIKVWQKNKGIPLEADYKTDQNGAMDKLIEGYCVE